MIGSAVLGIFGENAAPRDAFAAVDKAALTGSYSDLTGVDAERPIGRKELSAAYQPQPEAAARLIVPERDLNNANLYPEITSEGLPYGDGKTVVIDAEIDTIGDEENITTITKQVPPEPTDETFQLAQGPDADRCAHRPRREQGSREVAGRRDRARLPGSPDEGRHHVSNSRSTASSTSTAAT